MEDILEGNLTLEHEPLTCTVRLFISSDFADSQWERKYLSQRALPHLRRYCQSLGLQFHAVDLYQGIQPLPDASHTMYEMERDGILQQSLREIRMCQSMSGGPNFVTLLAQKYGHKPLQRCIPGSDFNLLCAAIEDQATKKLVQKWYRQNTNVVPPEYVLQPFEWKVHDSVKNSTAEEWETIHSLLSKAIRKAAKVALGKDPGKVQNYTMSATEEEVSVGIFNAEGDPNKCCFWFKRTFADLLEQKPSDLALLTFTDLTMGRRGLEFDVESTKTLNHLKEARMPASYVGLDSTNIFEFSLKWQKNKGLDPLTSPTHSSYLDDMCERFSSALEEKIADLAVLLQSHEGNSVYQEVLCHGVYGKEKINGAVVSRESVTSAIHSYLSGPSNNLLVVYGVLGSGKTSVIATAAYQLRKRAPVKKMAIILRFLGITPHSSSICHTLQSICKQISYVYDEDVATIPGDYKGRAEHFKLLLQRATAEKPLYLFLDAVDQLSPEDGALGLSWLPLALPPHVKVVLSTSSEVRYRCFPVLQSMLSKYQDNFIEVPQLSQLECQKFLRSTLASRKKRVTTSQEVVILEKLSVCPLPLHLALLMNKVSNWTSYTEVTLADLSSTSDVSGLILDLFHKLEEEHGHLLVGHMIAYVTASRHGLTETELLDILCCDHEVMDELNRHRSENALTSVPPIVWCKLLQDLDPLLVFRVGVGKALVLRWAHRQIEEVATAQYLCLEADGGGHKVFFALADYFSGKLAQVGMERQKEQSTPSSSRGTSQAPAVCIYSQPLFLSEDSMIYNVRKLKELPYCLAKCGRYAELENLLLSFEWIKACIHATSCADLITDISQVVPVVPLGRHGMTDDSSELRLLREALSYSVEALTLDPSQLSTQLLGRLLPCLQQQTGDARPHLRELVCKALNDAKPIFSPLQPLFHLPGNPMLVSMQGHRDLVSAIASTTVETQNGEGASLCIVSSSWDKTLKSWDLGSTGVLKTFDGHTDKVLSVAVSSDGQYAISGSEDMTVRMWYVTTSQCLHTMQGHSAAVHAVVVVTDGSKAVSGSSDTTVKVWNSDPQSSSTGQLIFTLRSHCSPVFALALSGNEYLASGAKDGTIVVTNIVSGEALRYLEGGMTGITALAVTQLHSSIFLCSGSEDGAIRVWDLPSGDLKHILLSGEDRVGGSPITSIAAGPNGKVITTCDKRLVSVWDITSASHLYDLPGHADAVTSSIIADAGSLVITGSADCTLSIWDLENPPVTQNTNFHCGPVPSVVISPCGTYGLSVGVDSVVKIYELSSLRVVKELKGHKGAINHVLVFRDSRRLLTASSDMTINLWDAEKGVHLQSFQGHEAAVNSVAITIDSELLMSGAEDGKVTFWSLTSGKMLRTFSNHSSAIVMVAFAKTTTAHYMVSASRDGSICIRDFYCGKVLLTLTTHTEDLLCVSVSPDASFLATGSADKTTHIYNLPGGSLKTTLSEHNKAVTCIKVLADCKKILTGSADKTLRIWNVQTAECLACLYTDLPISACDVSRNMTILYGTENGWVSTALYQNNPAPPNVLLQGLRSPSDSSFTESQSSFATRSSQLDESTLLGESDHNTCKILAGAGLPTPTDIELSQETDTRQPVISEELQQLVQPEKVGSTDAPHSPEKATMPHAYNYASSYFFKADNDKLLSSGLEQCDGTLVSGEQSLHGQSAQADTKSSACLVL